MLFSQLYDVIMASQSGEKCVHETNDEDDVCVVGSLVRGKGKVPKKMEEEEKKLKKKKKQ